MNAPSAQQALEAICPQGIRTAWRDPTRAYALFPEEARLVAKARRTRVCEFSAGRDVARAALEDASVALGATADRAPLWPAGYAGSISHSAALCVAIAAPCSAYSALGIDVEPLTPLHDDLRDTVLHPLEIRASACEAKRIFSAKEALYKALNPACSRPLQFQDVALDHRAFDRSGLIPFEWAGPALPAGLEARTSLLQTLGAGHVISLVVVRPETWKHPTRIVSEPIQQIHGKLGNSLL